MSRTLRPSNVMAPTHAPPRIRVFATMTSFMRASVGWYRMDRLGRQMRDGDAQVLFQPGCEQAAVAGSRFPLDAHQRRDLVVAEVSREQVAVEMIEDLAPVGLLERVAQLRALPAGHMLGLVDLMLLLSDRVGRRQVEAVEVADAQLSQPVLQPAAVGERVLRSPHATTAADVDQQVDAGGLERREKASASQPYTPIVTNSIIFGRPLLVRPLLVALARLELRVVEQAQLAAGAPRQGIILADRQSFSSM